MAVVQMIGKLQCVSLWNVWKHVTQGSTRWLEDNLDVLREMLVIFFRNDGVQQITDKQASSCIAVA
jgi:hypothetical protein